MPNQKYDLVGDIHGHADELEKLLGKLGYSWTDGCYRHAKNKVIFLGDFIDRGPKQREVLQTVIPMVHQGSALAVMGNHELNALAFHTKNGDHADQWLRPRNNKNIQQTNALVFLINRSSFTRSILWRSQAGTHQGRHPILCLLLGWCTKRTHARRYPR